MHVEILRPFRGEVEYEIGQVVDATDWRTLRQLIDRRYVAPAAKPAARGKEKTRAE